jgi:hypothetical protein
MSEYRALSDVSADDVRGLFADRADDLHRKVDATRDAYCGFIFPVTRGDLASVGGALELSTDAARALYREGTRFSTFRRTARGGQITNHIVGASLLALRGQSLDTGLASIDSASLAGVASENKETVLEIAEARAAWFGRIYFPASSFASAITVFGGDVSADSFYSLAKDSGYAAEAGERKNVRGDFGIAVWLTLLATAT